MAKRNRPAFDDIHVCIDVCDDTAIDAVAACPSGAVGNVIDGHVIDGHVIVGGDLDFGKNVFDNASNVIVGGDLDFEKNVFDHALNVDSVDSFDNIVDDNVVNFRAKASSKFENKESSSFAASEQSESFKRRSLYSHECVCQKTEATPRERQVIINQFLILLSSYLCPKINFTGFYGIMAV